MTLKGMLGIDMLRRNVGSDKQKNRMRRRYIEQHAEECGYHLYSRRLLWQRDSDLLKGLAYRIPGISDDRCFTLLDIARRTAALPGDIAECGVRRGKSALFLDIGSGIDTSKRVYLFDSFEGLSAPSSRDDSEEVKSSWTAGKFAISEDVVRANLADFTNVKILKGWIPERFSEVADRHFSIVHIDVDLYQPTIDSLAFFYPRMVRGGFIICDDYGFDNCIGATRAFDEFFADKPQTILNIPTGQCIVQI